MLEGTLLWQKGDGSIYSNQRDKGWRNQKLEEAVDRFGHTQREVADFFGLPFTSVSRIMSQRGKMQIK